MNVADPTRPALRDASLLLVEAASSIAMAFQELRDAVLVLHNATLERNTLQGDPSALVRQSLDDALSNLGEASVSLDSAGRALGAKDD
jgi:hypothetical protein